VLFPIVREGFYPADDFREVEMVNWTALLGLVHGVNVRKMSRHWWIVHVESLYGRHPGELFILWFGRNYLFFNETRNSLNDTPKILILNGGLIMADVRDSIRIENVVATASFNQRFDLYAIVKGNPGVEYRPEKFPGLVFRLKKPKTAILIFSTGKMVCTGAKSEKIAKRAIKTVVKELKNSGIIIPGKPEIKIVNMVASANLLGRIELEDCAYSLGRTMYEPEQFPGLIYRMDEPKVVILIFASGKLVCTGATKKEDVYTAVENLHQDIKKKDLIDYS